MEQREKKLYINITIKCQRLPEDFFCIRHFENKYLVRVLVQRLVTALSGFVQHLCSEVDFCIEFRKRKKKMKNRCFSHKLKLFRLIAQKVSSPNIYNSVPKS